MKTKHFTNTKRRTMPNQTKIINTVGLTALGGLAMLSLAAIIPTPTNTVSAETITSELTTKTTAYLYSMISVALSNEINIDLTPKSTGSLSIGTAKLNVSTNNTTGYSIYLATVDGSNQLNPIDDSQTFTGSDTDFSIKPLTTTTTEADYLSDNANLNTWGYALTSSSATSDTTYQGLTSTSDNLVYHTEATTSNDSYDLNIAVAVDASLPAGGYRNGIIVSAVANPISISGFKSIYYMQEMTPEICASAKEHEEGQLVDKRDHKIYWVGKLKDGNCWMTQNLDLDLSTEVALTPEDTNVTESWTPATSTSKELYSVNPVADRGAFLQLSVDPGMYVQKSLTYQSMCEGALSLSDCPNSLDVSSGFSANYTATGDNAVNMTAKSYDAHYLVGNYYTFNAAVVGQASDSVMSITYEADICPKGWRLPNASPISDNGKNPDYYKDSDFYRLLALYGWDSGYQMDTAWANFQYTPISSNQGTWNLVKSPLYYSLWGSLHETPPSLDEQMPMVYSAIGGTRLWASTQYATMISRDFQFNFTGDNARLYPGSAGSYSYYGIPIRCLAK